jgi:high-affinity iron transporter
MRILRLGMWLALLACDGRDGDLPTSYRSLEVPDLGAPAQARGAVLFATHCALCHGADADGLGVRAESLSSRPPSFRSSDFRARMTPRRAFFVVREGKRGTSMAAWPALSDAETWDLVAFVLGVR